jgi:hypothetical protein
MVPDQNPLPVRLSYFSAKPNDNGIVLEWYVDNIGGKGRVEVMMSMPGVDTFRTISSVNLQPGKQRYQVSTKPEWVGKLSFKLKLLEEGREVVWSEVANAFLSFQGTSLVNIKPSVTRGSIHLTVQSAKTGPMQFCVVDMQGRMLKTKSVYVKAGVNDFVVNFSDLRGGFYHIFALSSTVRTNLLRFLKL